MELTKEEMITEIHKMDPDFFRLSINLDKFTLEEIQKHYLRKKNAPISKNKPRSNWYTSMQPTQRTRQVISEEYIVPRTKAPNVKEDKGISLTGFDALDKERIKDA